MQVKLLGILVLLLVIVGLGAEANAATQVVIVGDSTVANYAEQSHLRGWGQMIGQCFNDQVTVVNLAVGGRSTKTFIKEGRWKKALDLCQRGDYVLIQFGHNDSHAKDRPESTNAQGDYKQYLRTYVDDARKQGATPVLITPMHRRRFLPDGTITLELKPYADAMQEVAAEKDVVCVDLHHLSGTVMQAAGDEGCADLFCSATDRTHFSEKGARRMASLVANALRAKKIGLSKTIKVPVANPLEAP